MHLSHRRKDWNWKIWDLDFSCLLYTSGAAGYTMPLPEKDEMFITKGQLLQDIMVSLGGRIAEEIIFGDITTGASSDIKKATSAARDMVTRYGMSENIGVINYNSDDDEVFIGRDLALSLIHIS